MSYKDKLIKTSNKIRNDLNTKLHGKTYTSYLSAFQGFGGGSFGGAGAGVNWKEYPNNYVEFPQYERRTPIITKESFSQAFNRARIHGDPTFEFNGKIYTTEISDNPKYIGKIYQDKTSAVLREVLDDEMKVMSDSTRVEPFIGQPLGIRKRDESEYKYLDGGILFGKSGIHIKKKNRGKFTEYCGGKVTEECIARGKRSKNPLTRKRANFASVVRKWKHENGGILKALDYAQYITKKLD